jgi:hypothetical protein
MCNEVTHKYGSLCKDGDIWIGERGLIFIPRIYDKLLIVFHTGIRIFFFSFDICNLNEILNHLIREVEREQQFGLADHFDDDYHHIIYKFNLFTNDEWKITPKTRVEDIIICFLHKLDVIASWISFIPTFSIISLLINNNNEEGYISKDIESNLTKFNSVHDLPNIFNNLNSSSGSSSLSSSNSETVNEQVKKIKNQLPQQSKSNLNDMNFTEKDQLNKIKQ